MTGGASGIGLASVLTLVGAGARVAALDQHEVPLDGVVSLQVDLTDDGGVRAAVTRTVAALGGLDGRAYFRAMRAVWRMHPWDARHASQGPAPRHASIAGPFGPSGLRECHGWRGGPPHALASRS